MKGTSPVPALAKNVFAVHGLNAAGKAVLVRPRIQRGERTRRLRMRGPFLNGGNQCRTQSGIADPYAFKVVSALPRDMAAVIFPSAQIVIKRARLICRYVFHHFHTQRGESETLTSGTSELVFS